MEIAGYLQVWLIHFAPQACGVETNPQGAEDCRCPNFGDPLQQQGLILPHVPKHAHASSLSPSVHSACDVPVSHPLGPLRLLKVVSNSDPTGVESLS